MIVLWILALVLGVVAAAFGSQRAVSGALEVADGLGISKGLVGVTLMAVGTDLPEIANSISASITGHGDLNVGDSTGSALTQVTLILAILAFATPLLSEQTRGPGVPLFVPVGAMTVGSTLLIAILIRDEQLGRLDGLLLVTGWMVTMVAVGRWQHVSRVVPSATRTGIGRSLAGTMMWLALVAASATVIVQAFVKVTEIIGVPELVASTVVLALGTSLPELVVDWTAIRRGAASLALGDLFGSSLVDASLSIGIGPLIHPTAVSSGAVWTVLVVGAGIALATVIGWVDRTRPTAMAWRLLVVYLACMATIVAIA